MPVLRTRDFIVTLPADWSGEENAEGTLVLDFPTGSLCITVVPLSEEVDAAVAEKFLEADGAALREHEHAWSPAMRVTLAGYRGMLSRADVGERRLCSWALIVPRSFMHVTLDCPPLEEAKRIAEAADIVASLRGGRFAASVQPFVRHARKFLAARLLGTEVSEDARTVQFASGRILPLHHAFQTYTETRWPWRSWRTNRALARLLAAEMDAIPLDAMTRDFDAIRDRLRVRFYPADGAASTDVAREDFEGIESALVIDTSQAYFRVSTAATERWRVTLDQAYAIALRNVVAHTPLNLYRLEGPRVDGFYHLTDSEGFAAVRVLMPASHPEWFGPRGALFILADADNVFYLPLTHDVGMEQMQRFAAFLRHLYESGKCLLSAHLYWVHGHRIVTVPWAPDADGENPLLPSPVLDQIVR